MYRTISPAPRSLTPAPPIPTVKSWVALARRPESSASLVEVYSDLFTALSYSKNGLSRPCPETVIFSREGVFFYVYEWREQAVHLQPSHLTSNEVILRFFESGADEKATAAVWLSEMQDAKGVILTAQHMNKADLRAFLADTVNSGKVGVLQRFVTPRLLHDVEDVAHDLLVHYYNGSVVVERRHGVYPLDLSPNATLACNTLPIIPVEGKMQSTGKLPFHPSEWRKSKIELLTDPDLLSTCRDVCSEVRLSLEGYRTWEAHRLDLSPEEIAEAKGRGLRSLTLQMRVGRADRQLYFIGVLGMRYPPTRRHHEVDFHMTNCTPSEEAEEVSAVGNEFVFPQVMPPAPVATGNPQDKVSLTEMFAFLKTEKRVLRYAIFDGEHYLCPNCDKEYGKEKFVRMTYGELTEHYLTHSVNGKRETNALFPGAAVSSKVAAPFATQEMKLAARFSPASSRPSTAKGARPSSARSAVSAAADSERRGSSSGYVWHALPPVLKKLNVALAELVASRPRLSQSAALCEGCATKFGAVLADGTCEAQQQQPRPPLSNSPLRRSPLFPDPPAAQQHRRPISARPRPAMLPSEMADQIVLTNLQSRHRAMRQAERAAYEAALALHVVPPSVQELQHQRQQRLLEEEVAAILESFTMPATAGDNPQRRHSPSRAGRSPLARASAGLPGGESSPPPPGGSSSSGGAYQRTTSPLAGGEDVLHMGPGADVPLEMLLCSELFYCMTETSGRAAANRSGAADPNLFISSATTKKGTSCNMILGRGFPKPALLVPSEDLRPLADQRWKQLEHEYLSRSRKATSTAMRRLSTTFADLSEAERILLVDIAGSSSAVSVDRDSPAPAAGERRTSQ